jgi:predicted ABC-type transport system involved in lysophospholipase L1 biosynthesis ATPase subunit
VIATLDVSDCKIAIAKNLIVHLNGRVAMRLKKVKMFVSQMKEKVILNDSLIVNQYVETVAVIGAVYSWKFGVLALAAGTCYPWSTILQMMHL